MPLDYRGIEADALDSAFYRERGRLIHAMRREAAACIVHMEGIDIDVEPSKCGSFQRQVDGSTVFFWRGRPVIRFRFVVNQTPGRGMDLEVSRDYLQAKE